MILNAEQLSIIFSNEQEDLFVEALAGTGKTTSLMEFAKHRFESNILYLVSSKNMKFQSRKKFTSNTEVHSVNSFVYKYIKSIFNRKIINNINTKFVINNIQEISDIYKVNQTLAVQLAISALDFFNYFLNSNTNRDNMVLDSDKLYIKCALILYDKMISGEINITHNALLKYFLDNYDFTQFNYDYLLIDEAQDINPIMFNIINKIKGKKVYVGDSKQNIFKFRNTINLLQNKNTKKLTGTYRFGKNIAGFISDLTASAYNEKDFYISGLSDNLGFVIFDNEEIIPPYAAYITRTNAHLFDCAFESVQQGKKVSIPFNWEEIKILLMDIFYLKAGLYNSIKGSLLKDYNSFQELLDIQSHGGDQELIFLVKLIDKYGLELPEKIKILEHNLASSKFADIIYITAHKAKGLEFYSVELGNDFKKYRYGTEIEERNLIYVAMTRAMEILKPNKDLIEQYIKGGI